LFCFDHAVAWDSSRTGPANTPHATVGSLLKATLGDLRRLNKATFGPGEGLVCDDYFLLTIFRGFAVWRHVLCRIIKLLIKQKNSLKIRKTGT
jgi:hypothetical protein